MMMQTPPAIEYKKIYNEIVLLENCAIIVYAFENTQNKTDISLLAKVENKPYNETIIKFINDNTIFTISDGMLCSNGMCVKL